MQAIQGVDKVLTLTPGVCSKEGWQVLSLLRWWDCCSGILMQGGWLALVNGEEQTATSYFGERPAFTQAAVWVKHGNFHQIVSMCSSSDTVCALTCDSAQHSLMEPPLISLPVLVWIKTGCTTRSFGRNFSNGKHCVSLWLLVIRCSPMVQNQ